MSDPWGPPEGEGRPNPAPAPPSYGQPGNPGYGGQLYQNPPGQPAYGQPAHGQPAYGQPAYGQPAYGTPGYGSPGYGAPPQETDQNAVVALVLAVLSWVVCPLIFAIVAIVMARNSERAIAQSHGAKTGEGLAKAARIVSWVNVAVFGGFLVLGVIFLVFSLVAVGAGAAS